MPTISPTTEQQLVCQCPADGVLNQTRHWPRAHEWVETLLGKVRLQVLAERVVHLLLMQLILKLHEELVHHTHDDLFRQRREGNYSIQPVTEFRAEQALDLGHFIASLGTQRETDTGLGNCFSTSVGSHDDGYVAEICLAAVVVRQCAMIHDLRSEEGRGGE